MPSPSRTGPIGGPRRRARVLGLTATAAVAAASAAALALSGGASAAPAPAADRPDPAGPAALAGPRPDVDPQHWADGSYIVLLDERPAATYTGGIRGLAATRPTAGERLRPADPDVARYRRHLADRQAKLLGAVGARATYRYTLAANGFSARLSGQQAARLAGAPGVLSVTPDLRRRLSTVVTPDLLGLTSAKGPWAAVGGAAKAGEGIVIGVIDTGIDPAHRAFAGRPVTRTTPGAVGEAYRTGPGSIAVRKLRGGTFTGTCQAGPGFAATACNSTVVAARFYDSGLQAGKDPDDALAPDEVASPLDVDGHGTHVASTAAGRPVRDVTIDGQLLGTARGMAPAAKIAMYKACWLTVGARGTCPSSDLVKAIDQAVSDGVDVISYSIGGAPAADDPVGLAFMSATTAGIFVSAAAGNDGPDADTVQNVSPWVTTVAATTAALYEGTVRLGNGQAYVGAKFEQRSLPAAGALYATRAAAKGVAAGDAAQCLPDSLDPAAVRGKVVVCDRGANARVEKSAEVARAGGVGMVLLNVTEGDDLATDLHPVPTVHLPQDARAKVLAYLAANPATATVALQAGNTSGSPRSATPVVAGFSSRGRDPISGGDVVKPDVAAPGVAIVAGVPRGASLGDYGSNDYAPLSGTSMATPHISGLAALVLQAHPKWSPMAVKSAILTTARNTVTPAGRQVTDPTLQGAGTVDPRRFLDPGLVYDSGPKDWQAYRESLGIDTGTGVAAVPGYNLNQASIGLAELVGRATVTRTVTATATGTYRASASVPGLSVTVSPSTLTFDSVGQRKTFTVTLRRTSAAFGELANGFLTWRSGDRTVRSPISVLPVSASGPGEVHVDTVTATGSVKVPVALGDRTVDARLIGLTAAKVSTGQVEIGPVTADEKGNAANVVVPVDIPAGTGYARVELVSPKTGTTTALTVYDKDFNLVSSTLLTEPRAHHSESAPDQQRWWVTVTGWEGKAKTVPYELRVFLVPDRDAGNSTLTPRPLTGALGEQVDLTLGWRGLRPRTPYLGLLSYGGDLTAFSSVVSLG